MKHPLDLDATIIGPVVELRYASHSEAFQQLRELRRLVGASAELLEALRGMCSVWRTVCNSKGWEPAHVTQFVTAVEALSKATVEQP